MERLVVFDIDQTLLYSGGAGIRAMNRAFEELTGIPKGFQEVEYAGRTDPQIVRQALTLHGLRTDDDMIDQVIRRYLDHFPGEMEAKRATLKPGVTRLLTRLEAEPGWILGILTGNVEQGARMKLEHFGLNPFFPVGAFGSDCEDRNELLPVLLQRLRKIKGVSVDYRHCVVVGDTPMDVECARVHGSRSIAVATGPYSVEELTLAQADLVLSDLSGTDLIVSWIKDAWHAE